MSADNLAFLRPDPERALAAAMAAAERAAGEEAKRRAAELFTPWGAPDFALAREAELFVRTAAVNAALPMLRRLTPDYAMREIIAHGMAEEALIHLRKRGAA